MMTARVDATDVAAGRAAGVDEYITKPFVLRDLVRRVRAALPRRVGVRPSAAAVAVT
jgi:DNA-binding response OmpR family regulator